MRKHSKPRCARRSSTPDKPARQSAPSATAPTLRDHCGFVRLLLQRTSLESLTQLETLRRHRAGRPAYKLSRAQLLVGLLFHFAVHLSGTLAEHLVLLTGISMAESSLSQRRVALPFEVFEQLLQRILRPLARVGQQAEGFYKGLRLVAIDGVNFSLPNTADVKARCRKGGNHRSRAAFAKLPCAVLLELALHNPLAARLGRQGESEWCLAKRVLSQLPSECLLLGDRLYGCAAFVVAALAELKQRKGYFLLRVKNSLKVRRVIQRLGRDSRLVEVGVWDPKNHHRMVQTVVVREIEVRVQRPGFRAVRVRLWTNLMDEQRYPALELAQLYTGRWEQELYFRELKHQIGINDLLQSQTVETAAQEVAAMIIVTSLVAGERAQLQPGEELSSRISFLKVWELLDPLWLTLSLCSDLLSEEQMEGMVERFRVAMSRMRMAKKRQRSCPRVLRQPVQPWPKKKRQRAHSGPVSMTIASRPG